MTINEIKDLTKFLSEEEVEEIKKEIKSKEDVLKSGSLDEEEMIQVLNTFFAILVIEKALESEIEGVEEIRDDLEQELLEAYETYDSYMARYKKEDKKKKKRWLLDFLGLSENIRSKKDGISSTNKTISKLQNELNTLKQQRNADNLKQVAEKNDMNRFNEFCDCPHKCEHPHHHHEHHEVRERMAERRAEIIEHIRDNARERMAERRAERPTPPRVKEAPAPTKVNTQTTPELPKRANSDSNIQKNSQEIQSQMRS